MPRCNMFLGCLAAGEVCNEERNSMNSAVGYGKLTFDDGVLVYQANKPGT